MGGEICGIAMLLRMVIERSRQQSASLSSWTVGFAMGGLVLVVSKCTYVRDVENKRLYVLEYQCTACLLLIYTATAAILCKICAVSYLAIHLIREVVKQLRTKGCSNNEVLQSATQTIMQTSGA